MTRPLALMTAFALCLAVGCGKKSDTAGGGRSGDPPPDSDKGKLQGLWGVESMDAGARLEDFPPDEVAREMERAKQGRYHFEGNRLTVTMFGNEDRFTFDLDEALDPKVLKVTELRAAEPYEAPRPGTARSGRGSPTPPESMEWIYAFDGDVLTIALGMKTPKKPTAFKPQYPSPGTPGVLVVRLKKTGTPAKSDPGPLRSATVPRR